MLTENSDKGRVEIILNYILTDDYYQLAPCLEPILYLSAQSQRKKQSLSLGFKFFSLQLPSNMQRPLHFL
jgi:hypothetical protein